jgi:hypothetical protein
MNKQQHLATSYPTPTLPCKRGGGASMYLRVVVASTRILPCERGGSHPQRMSAPDIHA